MPAARASARASPPALGATPRSRACDLAPTTSLWRTTSAPIKSRRGSGSRSGWICVSLVLFFSGESCGNVHGYRRSYLWSTTFRHEFGFAGASRRTQLLLVHEIMSSRGNAHGFQKAAFGYVCFPEEFAMISTTSGSTILNTRINHRQHLKI